MTVRIFSDRLENRREDLVSYGTSTSDASARRSAGKRTKSDIRARTNARDFAGVYFTGVSLISKG